MSATITRPAAASLEDNPRALLENALQHLRHALRLITNTNQLVVGGTLESQATQRCAVLYTDVTTAARSCADLIDHLDGYSDAARRQLPPLNRA